MKSKKANTGLVTAAIILIALVVVSAGGLMLYDRYGGIGLSVAGTGTGSGEGDPLGAECSGGETQSLLIKGVNEYTGAAVTDNFSYRIAGVGDSWTEGTMGTAIVTGIQVGAKYEFVPGISPTSETGDAYGAYFTIDDMPCQKIEVINVVDDTLYSDMSGTFYNSDENAAAQDADADAGADWVSVKWQAASDEEAGNKFIGDYPNIVCMNLNSTHHDLPEAMFNSVSMKKASQPTVHASAAGMITSCFEAPVFNENPQKYYIKIDPDNTNFAQMDVDAIAYLYTGSHYIDSEDATLQTGVETDDGNFVGFTAADQVTLDFT